MADSPANLQLVDADRGQSSAAPARASNLPRTGTNVSRVPIEFRTLSIQISDSHRVDQAARKRKGRKGGAEDDPEYFQKIDFHKLGVPQVCQQLNVAPDRGLDVEVAARRLQRNGKNTIATHRENYIKKLLQYIFGGFCSILWVGVVIFFICWRPLSNPPSATNLALAILVILVIFLQALFSAFQDWSTKKVMNSILDLLPSECVVIRDGESTKIPSTDIVVGDIVQLSSGNKVPADARLIEMSGDVRFDRSILTGEAEEIAGAIDMTDDNFLETRNVALMGTHVTNGTARAVVLLTGSKTVMGRISKLTNNTKVPATLIQREISRFVKIIIVLTVLLASAILFVWVGWLRVDHYDFINVTGMLDNVMGCVVAFIPEGMPVAVALTLSLVARRMKAANVLPKSLSTVETLGCVNVICSDKTGTLTRNQMSVASVGFVDGEVAVTDVAPQAAQGRSPFRTLQRAVVLCNNAAFDPATKDLPIAQRKVNGDATDAAALCFAEGLGGADDIRKANAQVFQIPFNSKNKWMMTLFDGDGAKPVDDDDYGDMDQKRSPYRMYVKGAPDVLVPRCTSYWSVVDDEIRPFDEHAKARLVALQSQWSRGGQRVILLCTREYVAFEPVGSNAFGEEMVEHGLTDLTIIGLLGIMDPPRPEIVHTVAECRRAGARFFMVTGDFGLTAAAIAKQTGIFTGEAEPDFYDDINKRARYAGAGAGDKEGGSADGEGSKGTTEEEPFLPYSLVLEGKDMVKLTDDQWDTVCRYHEIVFARTTPEQKLKIVNELKDRGNVVAVTGDGVNDAPALKAADVGIAIVTGSDVAIEAADLVLLGSFASITDGIRLGRLVFQNLQKVIGYLLPAGSWSEIWPVLLNVFFGVPLPLSSFLMIIICCFTDLAPCLSLIMEKEEFDLLTLPPRDSKRDHLINARIYTQSYLFVGVMEAIVAHSMFFFYMWKHAGIPVNALFFAFGKYSDGFYGHTADELTLYNNTGQCVYFVTLVILQWGNLLSIRNKRLSILQADPFRPQRRNPWLFLGALFSFVTAIFVTEVPGINSLFNTAPVPIEFWLIPLPLALGILVIDEVRKLVVRTWPKGPIARIAW